LELARAYCTKRGWTLSEATYRDLGVSAFRGKNALVGNLGEFLRAVEAGNIQRGSALVVESLDRITRQGIDAGYETIKRILKAGVLLVTLSPEREFDVSATRSLSKGALEIQLILERAAEESEIKSKRVSAAWREKQRRVRAGELQRPLDRNGTATRCMTRRLPLWLKLENGVIEVIKERAQVVRKIFHWSAAGFGACQIIGRLTRAGIPAFGGKGWFKTYITRIIRDRRALGEYQPCKGGKPDGPPVPGYFPAVVTEREWLAANEQMVSRTLKKTRNGKYVNLFSGLLWNARQPGDTYKAATSFSGRKPGLPGVKQRVLVTNASSQGRGEAHSFPHESFERAILSVLAEINVKVLFPPENGSVVSESEQLEEELKGLRAKKLMLQEQLDRMKPEDQKYVGGIVEVLIGVEKQIAETEQRHAGARIKEVHPTSESWKECRGLLEALDSAEDPVEVRVRLRAALRRIIKGIWLMVVGRGRIRLCEALILFHNGGSDKAYRGVQILHKSGENNRHGKKSPARSMSLTVASFCSP
jgi:DNA invertase Pin-like site-specific DNA recombinase